MDECHIADLRRRYASYFGEQTSPTGVIASLESLLDVELPRDLKAITEFYRGGMIGGISHNSFAIGGAATNIAEETLRLRTAVNLSHRFIVLADQMKA